MTRLIRQSERDIATLDKLRSSSRTSDDQPKDYRNKVVVKPWGYEFLIYESSDVAIWFLHLDKGHSTSMHCHTRKKTSLIVASGQALCNTFYNRNYLSGVDGVVIESGVFHSTQSLSAQGIDLIEVESPPDKLDLVRLNDRYGREGRSYEGLSEMKEEYLERYGYFTLEPNSTHSAKSYEVGLIQDSGWVDPRAGDRGQMLCCCGGGVVAADGTVILGVGDVAEMSYVLTFDPFVVQPGSLFITIRGK